MANIRSASPTLTNLQKSLPFAEVDEIEDTSPFGLLQNGQVKYNYAKDGIMNFHSIKICTSNSKALSYFFQVSLGFSPIAFKGLETGSYYLASHVIENGNVKIEIVNPLHGKDIHEPTSHLLDKNHSGIVTMVDELIKMFLTTFPNFQIDEQDIRKSVLNKFAVVSELKKKAGKAKAVELNEKCESFYGGETVAQFEERKIAREICLERLELIKIQNYLAKHGDGVIDISILIENCSQSYKKAIKAGALAISSPTREFDKHGSTIVAVIGVPNSDMQHTFIQNIDYIEGPFLPNFGSKNECKDDLFYEMLNSLPNIELDSLDHCVENYTWGQMNDAARFYAAAFGFHKFWSVDEADVSTGNSSLKSIVMSSSNGKVNIPINEPGEGGTKKGQIEEYFDFNEGPGIQHLAFKTYNIIGTVQSMIARGVEFNIMEGSYYDELIERMKKDDVIIKEDLAELRKLSILVDYDPSTRNSKSKVCHYILQIFTKPLTDRPTLFFEIIQRHHHNGFGKGTFKGLFKSIEAQQILRGTLTDKI